MPLPELERLYAEHEAEVSWQRAAGHNYISLDRERVAKLAEQVPCHRRFFRQKVKEDVSAAHLVLRESVLFRAVVEEGTDLSPSARTMEALREAWLRVLEENEREGP